MEIFNTEPNQHLIDAAELAADEFAAEKSAPVAKATPRRNYRRFWAVAHKRGLNPDDRTALLIALSLKFGRPVLSRTTLSDAEFELVLADIEDGFLTW